MVHPSTGWTVAELLHRLEEPPHYVAIAGIDAGQTMNLAATSAQISGAHLLLDPLPPRYPPGPDDAETKSGRRELQAIAARLEQLSGLPAGCTSILDRLACVQLLVATVAGSRTSLVGWSGTAAGGAGLRAGDAASAAAALRGVPGNAIDAGVDAAAGAQGPHGSARRHRDTVPRHWRELSHQVSLPDQGPILRIPGGDLRLALTELTAAIDAMR